MASGSLSGNRPFGQRMLEIAHDEPSRDCLILCRGRPACYTSALAAFRRCLLIHTTCIDQSSVMWYTLHSLKATTLSWAMQLDLPISKGWEPIVPLLRGVQRMPAAAPVDEALEDSQGFDCMEECVKSEAGSDACSSDSEGSLLVDATELEVDEEDEGRWLVNGLTGWFHRLVESDEGGVNCIEWNGKTLVRACRPCAAVPPHYILMESFPLLQGFQCCAHSGCFPPA